LLLPRALFGLEAGSIQESYTDLLQVRKTPRPTTLRPSLQPGAILIVLAGRFRGKRVVYLKNLGNGVLLVTGPFRINGVPLRRVNARFVIATSTKVDLAGVDTDKFDEKYFAREKESKKSNEEKFYEGGKKVKVRTFSLVPGKIRLER
jgi:large subunit ribosomal protein L6e